MNYQRFKELVYGSEPEFELKEIIFHKICFISTFALAIGLAVSLYINQWEMVMVIMFTQLVLTLSYWFSRIMGHFRTGWYLFVSISYVLFIANYFLNSGIEGTTTVMSFMTLSILFAVTKSKSHWKWSAVHALIFGSLIIYEQFYGRDLIIPYESSEYRYSDHITMYILTVGFFYLIFSLIKEAYENQQKKLAQQSLLLAENKEELQKSNKDLTKILSILAHDVRNPLASIEGYLELLQANAIPTAERGAFESELLNMVQTTGHMLDDMVHWSKGQLGGYQANFKEQTIGSWLNRTIEHLRGMAHAKGVGIDDDYNGSEKILCDPILMTVVIRNLLQNAIKFTPSGKRIQFKAQKIEGGYWFQIKDEGIGISPENIPNLFSGKAESVLGTKAEQGTGFGLLIVKEYVDLHQGKIEVHSKVGEGSTFTIIIPTEIKQAPPAPHPQNP